MLYGMPAGLFVSGFFFPLGVLLYWFTNNLWTLGQQFYILRKMPMPGSAAAKEKDGRPPVDPKSLAPRPGAKPVRNRPGRPAVPPPAVSDAKGADAKGADAKGADAKGADAKGADGNRSDATSGGQQNGPVGTGSSVAKGTGKGSDDARAAADGPPPVGEDRPTLNGKPIDALGPNSSTRPGGRSGRAGQGPGNRSKRKRR
jgi:YidC/Oxa1 family membrane protein insertase